MKRDGVANLFKPSDIRHYPLFYIELTYAISTLAASLLLSLGLIDVEVPGTPGLVWELSGSGLGILTLGLIGISIATLQLYGLFKGGFKWRARAMLAQFSIRLYVTIGLLSVFGLVPTNWLNTAVLCIVAGIIYLRLKIAMRFFGEDNA